jgi:hypothetical protein
MLCTCLESICTTLQLVRAPHMPKQPSELIAPPPSSLIKNMDCLSPSQLIHRLIHASFRLVRVKFRPLVQFYKASVCIAKRVVSPTSSFPFQCLLSSGCSPLLLSPRLRPSCPSLQVSPSDSCVGCSLTKKSPSSTSSLRQRQSSPHYYNQGWR